MIAFSLLFNLTTLICSFIISYKIKYKNNISLGILFFFIIQSFFYIISIYGFLLKLNIEYFFLILFIVLVFFCLINFKLNKIINIIYNLRLYDIIFFILFFIYLILSQLPSVDIDSTRYHLFIPKNIIQGKFFENYTLDYSYFGSNEFLNLIGLYFKSENYSSTLNLFSIFFFYLLIKIKNEQVNFSTIVVKILIIFSSTYLISNLSSQKLYVFPCFFISYFFYILIKEYKNFNLDDISKDKIFIYLLSASLIFITTVKLFFLLLISPIFLMIFYKIKKKSEILKLLLFCFFISFFYHFPILYIKNIIFLEPFFPFFTFEKNFIAELYKSYIVNYDRVLNFKNLILTPINFFIPLKFNDLFKFFGTTFLIVFFLNKKNLKIFLLTAFIYFILIILIQNLQIRWFLPLYFFLILLIFEEDKFNIKTKFLVYPQAMLSILLCMFYILLPIFGSFKNNTSIRSFVLDKLSWDYEFLSKTVNHNENLITNTENLYYIKSDNLVSLYMHDIIMFVKKDFYYKKLEKKDYLLVYFLENDFRYESENDLKFYVRKIFNNKINIQSFEILKVKRNGRSKLWKEIIFQNKYIDEVIVANIVLN